VIAAAPPPAELEGLSLVWREGVPLAERTTLRIGGPARYLAEVADAEALAAVLRFGAARGLPVRPLGKGSNVLLPDDGFPGIILVLSGGDFTRLDIEGTTVRAGGGVSLMKLYVETKERGLSGFENLSGIPSSFAAAIRINAGSYGTELFELLTEVFLVTRAGEPRTLPAAGVKHGYRWTELLDGDDIVTGGALTLVPKPKEEIEARFKEVSEKRGKALPKQPNAGSIFKNPPGQFAGKLLEECGLKGRQAGNAMISPVHANVIVNLGGASARDVLALMDVMRAAVLERFGLELRPEVEVIRATE